MRPSKVEAKVRTAGKNQFPEWGTCREETGMTLARLEQRDTKVLATNLV